MNKQKLKNAIEKLPQVVVKTPTDVVSVEHVSAWSVLDLVDQLDEPQRVVIPPLVAGYIVHCQSYGMSLVRALTDIESSCKDHVAMNVQDWLSRQENQEPFARAWLDGYEVEREKLYTVEIPNPHHDGITVLEKVEDYVILSQMDYYLTNWRKGPEYQLTESEIRKDFDWAWQWAEEVKEVDY